MIDARVDDAVKQHHQKMDWLYAEKEAQAKTLTPPKPGGSVSEGKIGFTLPPTEAPQAQDLIAPVLSMTPPPSAEDLTLTPPPSTEDLTLTPPPPGDCSVIGDAQDKCEKLAEAAAEAVPLERTTSCSGNEDGLEKKDASKPPKDGSPV